MAAETFKDTCNSSIQHSPTSLAISLAHKLQSTQHQVKQLQEQSACSQEQYEAAINVQKNIAEQLHKLECRTQELELQQQSMQRHMGIANMSGNRLKIQSQQSRAQELAGSVAGRLQHLEQRVKCLSQTTSNIQVRIYIIYTVKHLHLWSAIWQGLGSAVLRSITSICKPEHGGMCHCRNIPRHLQLLCTSWNKKSASRCTIYEKTLSMQSQWQLQQLAVLSKLKYRQT